MTCMCGDIHCGSCGPAQGHSVCEECGWCGCDETDHAREITCNEENIKRYEELAEAYKREEELAEEEKKLKPTESWDDWYNRQTNWDKEQIDLYRNEKYGFCLPEEVFQFVLTYNNKAKGTRGVTFNQFLRSFK